ncbi:ABC transporter ATP-binding protein, partial [Psychrosphaera haliotis]|nr:ABC transporter ATP-binding protein [Psychrosphaera haliotis]
VDFNDQPILQYGLKDKAKQIAFIEQLPELTFDLSVYDAVLAGRLPYQGLFSFSNSTDKNRILSALEKMELLDKESQPFNTLSGGEQQRALIARSLVQGATTLLLDEPTNHLDIRHQLELMQTLQEFDGSVIMTIHDLNMASHYCDYLILINEGEVVKYGEPKEVLNAELISTTYKVETVVKESSLGTPYLYFCLAESDPINSASNNND